MTHTYAVLQISPAAWKEIADKLKEAGYDHAFDKDPDGVVLDMHGIALQAGPAPEVVMANNKVDPSSPGGH